MKFGIREVCDLTFTKITGIGPDFFNIDTAKMSTLESSSSTVYAQGGKGNSRLIAWEGEKTLTFTVEDALLTLESFWALTGADKAISENSITYTIKTTSFAGYYSIAARTFVRDETGIDKVAIINIPKAKLQTSLNLAMAPTGDPSTFTFTFDAFPNNREDNILCTFTINELSDDVINDISTGIIRLQVSNTDLSVLETKQWTSSAVSIFIEKQPNALWPYVLKAKASNSETKEELLDVAILKS